MSRLNGIICSDCLFASTQKLLTLAGYYGNNKIMKKTIIFMAFCLWFITGNIFAQTIEDPKYKINPTKDKNSPAGLYIPENLEDCFGELGKMLQPELIEEMKSGTEDDMITYHHGLGTWLRNNWGLWSGSRLAKYFNGLGIKHPDDMSGVILDSFWRHLNNKPIELEGQVKYYKDYWEKEKTNKGAS
jgi:hypothetical protein